MDQIKETVDVTLVTTLDGFVYVELVVVSLDTYQRRIYISCTKRIDGSIQKPKLRYIALMASTVCCRSGWNQPTFLPLAIWTQLQVNHRLL